MLKLKTNTWCWTWTVAVTLCIHQFLLQLFDLWSLWIHRHGHRNPLWCFRMWFRTSFLASKHLKGQYSRAMKAWQRVALWCTDFDNFISKKLLLLRVKFCSIARFVLFEHKRFTTVYCSGRIFTILVKSKNITADFCRTSGVSLCRHIERAMLETSIDQKALQKRSIHGGF